mmetsp:Transcript_18845/g.13669  ORF Transcript_18845/g.13669 Transcript_18845/m.13669 type:complete len:131 (-) Transcript_18845:60-452(-)
MGAEASLVTQIVVITKWFAGKEIGLALGLKISCLRVASILNSQLTPRALDNGGLKTAYLYGLIICLFCFLMAMILVVLDKIYASPRYAGSQHNEHSLNNVNWRDLFATLNSHYWMLVATIAVMNATFYVG